MSTDQDDLREAVFDLHQYLSDQKPPLMVSDSIAFLMRFPPEVMAAEINSWLGNQVIEGAVADYLYHAAKKISALGDLDLVAKDEISEYRPRLAAALLAHSPEDQREVLKQNLDRLGGPAHSTGLIRRPLMPTTPGPASPAAAAAPAADPSLSRELRHLSLMLERLRPLAAAPPEQRNEAASHFMAAAAAQSRNAAEFQQRLRPLNEIGIDTATAQIFRTLAESLAGWMLPRAEGQASPAAVAEQVQAMRQIVTIADDPAEAAKRFREMVHAAIEQFNRGELGRAVTMFEMAELLIAENKIKPVYVDALRKEGHQYLDQGRLKKFAERADLRAQLRVILQFFATLQPIGLLKALDGEADRDRRHQLLALLEVHGASARDAAWEMLKASVAEGERPNPYLQMNLVYLLRIIARPKTLSVDEEVGVVVRVSGRTSPTPLVKQVIAYLAHVRHEKAEKALFSYLKVFETMILNPASAVYSPADLDMLLDRTCAALARYGTPRAWMLMIDHGLKTDPRLGTAYLRLAEAGRFDLSSSRDLVLKVVTALQSELPRGGLMGLGTKTNESKALALIQALSGTPMPEVIEAFTKITEKHRGKLGDAAAKALTALAALGKPPVQAAFSGSLEIFGLPNVLQTIAQSQLSGVLAIVNEAGRPQASLVFSKGAFCGGEFEKIVGETAVYQLLERPFPGTFTLVNRTDGKGPAPGPPQEVFGLLMEGVRRHDEFKRAAALVPDGASLKATDKARTKPEGEDEEFLSTVWNGAGAGKTPIEIEALINTDAFRIRQALAHWVDEGALAPR